MTTEKARWTLACAQKDFTEASIILDNYFDVIPVPTRLELQLARANLEWVIEQLTLRINGSSVIKN